MTSVPPRFHAGPDATSRVRPTTIRDAISDDATEQDARRRIVLTAGPIAARVVK